MPAGLDGPALERLYVELERPLYNVVYRWLFDASETRDVIQEAFLRVWRARERLEVSSATPILYRTAINLASNRRRARRLWGWLPLAPQAAAPQPSPEEDLGRATTQRQVREAIAALPERLKRVILLCELAELSYQEVAEILKIPVGTVGSRRNQALALLGQKLGSIEGVAR